MTKKFLLIEDEDDIREIAALSLWAFAGWEVASASSGASGIKQAIAERPDAILLDVMMPGMDGPATLRQLQVEEATRHIPVIFMTAKLRLEERQFLAALGARGFIAKPFDPMMLAMQVAGVLGWK